MAVQRIGPVLCLAGGLATLPIAAPVESAEFTGYLTLTSDYVYRGVTYSDGHVAAQVGGDVALDSGLYFGLWASTVDIQNGPTRQRDTQVNYYAGYGFDLNSRWSIGASIVAHTFPGATGGFNYDFEEYSVSANYRDRAWLEYSYSPDLYDTNRETHNVELFAEWSLRWQLILGAGIGYYDVAELAGEGYAHWQIGLTRSIGRIDMDLRFHDTSRWVPIVSTPDRAEPRVSLSARLQF